MGRWWIVRVRVLGAARLSPQSPCSVRAEPELSPRQCIAAALIIVSTGLYTRASVCFGVLGVILNALEPDVAFLVQPLQPPACMGDTGDFIGERRGGCTPTGALL